MWVSPLVHLKAGWLGDSSWATVCVHGLISSERVRRLEQTPIHCGEGSVGRSTSFSLSNTRCRRRLISGQRLVNLPQDVHTASWQTLGLGSAAVSVQCSAPTTRFKENMKNKQTVLQRCLPQVTPTASLCLISASSCFYFFPLLIEPDSVKFKKE